MLIPRFGRELLRGAKRRQRGGRRRDDHGRDPRRPNVRNGQQSRVAGREGLRIDHQGRIARVQAVSVAPQLDRDRDRLGVRVKVHHPRKRASRIGGGGVDEPLPGAGPRDNHGGAVDRDTDGRGLFSRRVARPDAHFAELTGSARRLHTRHETHEAHHQPPPARQGRPAHQRRRSHRRLTICSLNRLSSAAASRKRLDWTARTREFRSVTCSRALRVTFQALLRR